MAEDDEVLSFDEVLESVENQMKALTQKMDDLQKDIIFIKEKVDNNGLKLYHINKKIDEILQSK